MCALVPRLDTRTRVTLVVHAKELKRTSNTGRLAVRALVNSEMLVRGEERERLDLSPLVKAGYRNWLFYPSEDALELTPELVASAAEPVHLIVPDGNWRQASKVHTRHPELAGVPRVKITTRNPYARHLRAETTEYGMATLAAIAAALAITDSKEIGARLGAVYEEKLARTLRARGLSTTEDFRSQS